jgi:hypothetical protein
MGWQYKKAPAASVLPGLCILGSGFLCSNRNAWFHPEHRASNIEFYFA